MTQTIGYAATISRTNGELGSFGIDHASGYPYLTETLKVRRNMAEAISDMKTLQGMKGYYDSDAYDFKTITIKRIVAEDIPDMDIEMERKLEIVKKLKKNFTAQEIDIISKLGKV
jgi:hypothetical protein